MPSRDSLSWAYHDDFAQLIVNKTPEVTLRLLQTADIALCFARALIAKEFATAHTMLSEELQASCPPTALQTNLEEMIHFNGDESRWPTLVQVVTGTDCTEMRKWAGKTPDDFGWTYVSIVGSGEDVYCEAVAVTVGWERDQLVIREIDWGRP